MKASFKEIIFKIEPIYSDSCSEIVASVSIILIDDLERYFIVGGFTIRKDIYTGKICFASPENERRENYHIEIEYSLQKIIEREVLSKFKKESISIIEEDKI